MPTPRNRPELKLLLGVEPRHREATSPKPGRREPEPMPWFTEEQRIIWDEVTVELREMGMLTNADRYEIAAYVALVSHLNRAIDQLNACGEYTLETEKSTIVHPLLIAVDRLTARAHQLARHLGLNPAARSAIHGRSTVKANTEAANIVDLYAS